MECFNPWEPICVFSCSVVSDCLWPHDCSPPGSSVHGIILARILEWVALSSSRASSWSRDPTHISCVSRQILHRWATEEALIYERMPCKLWLTGHVSAVTCPATGMMPCDRVCSGGIWTMRRGRLSFIHWSPLGRHCPQCLDIRHLCPSHDFQRGGYHVSLFHWWGDGAQEGRGGCPEDTRGQCSGRAWLPGAGTTSVGKYPRSRSS